MKFKVILLTALALAACSVDKTDLGHVESPTLSLRAVENATQEPSPDNIALSMSWTAPENCEVRLEMSPVPTFSGKVYSQSVSSESEIQFTFGELNEIMLGVLGMEAGIQSPLYIMVEATQGSLSSHSDIVKVAVTPGAVINPAALTCSTEEAVLTASTPDKLALSLSWTKNGAGVENAVQFAPAPDFLMPYTESVGTSVHDRQYTYGVLNKILCGSLGYKAGTEADLYVRIVSYYQTAAAYSNIIRISVTPEAETPATGGPAVLYVAGASPADPWNFDDYLIQYNATSMSYCGTICVDSQWGYKFYPEKDNWDFCYTRSSGTALSGYLTIGNAGSANMYRPDPGMYLFNVSLGNYTYSLTKVSTVSYTGFNDNWTMTRMTQSDGNPTVFTGKVTVTKPNPYRWQIIINSDWSLKLCAVNGYLLLDNEGPADEKIENGIYTLTADLGKGTYSLVKQN